MLETSFYGFNSRTGKQPYSSGELYSSTLSRLNFYFFFSYYAVIRLWLWRDVYYSEICVCYIPILQIGKFSCPLKFALEYFYRKK